MLSILLLLVKSLRKYGSRYYEFISALEGTSGNEVLCQCILSKWVYTCGRWLFCLLFCVHSPSFSVMFCNQEAEPCILYHLDSPRDGMMMVEPMGSAYGKEWKLERKKHHVFGHIYFLIGLHVSWCNTAIAPLSSDSSILLALSPLFKLSLLCA